MHAVHLYYVQDGKMVGIGGTPAQLFQFKMQPDNLPLVVHIPIVSYWY